MDFLANPILTEFLSFALGCIPHTLSVSFLIFKWELITSTSEAGFRFVSEDERSRVPFGFIVCYQSVQNSE